MYGTSLSAPIGTVDANMDLPGGLGGNFTGAGLHIIAADRQANTPSHVLRMVAINPQNEIVATAMIDMQPPTFGLDHTGARVTGTERNSSFRVVEGSSTPTARRAGERNNHSGAYLPESWGLSTRRQVRHCLLL